MENENVEQNNYTKTSHCAIIKLQPCRWMERLQLVDDAANKNEIHQGSLRQKRTRVRPNAGWKDNVENVIRKIGIVNGRKVAQDRDGWRRATRVALILFG